MTYGTFLEPCHGTKGHLAMTIPVIHETMLILKYYMSLLHNKIY
ncbi:hypothetical protein [Rickettsia endosymbiont of Polydrusus tereticollis]